MRCIGRATTAVMLITATCTGWSQERVRDRATLALVDGSTLVGDLLDSNDPKILRWQGTSFTTPFEFIVPAVSSVSFPTSREIEKPEGDFSFELVGRDVVTGRILAWSAGQITIESPRFGTLSILRSAVRRMYRNDENPSLVYTGPSGLIGWTTNRPGWLQNGPDLRTEVDGASLTGEFELPEKAFIEFDVTWQQTPDFVVAIGVDGRSNVDARLDGWRFETWGDQERSLALLCERRDGADIAEIGTLHYVPKRSVPLPRQQIDIANVDPFRGFQVDDGINRNHFGAKSSNKSPAPSKPLAVIPTKPPVPEKRVHLIAYLDQSAGTLQVYRPDGTFAGEVQVPRSAERTSARKVKRTVRLINRSGDLQLVGMRVGRWSGVLPTSAGGPSHMELADGSVLTGEVIGYQADAGELIFQSENGESGVPVEDVMAAEFASEDTVKDRFVTANLIDGTRISGKLDGLQSGEVTITNPHIVEALRIPRIDLQSLAFDSHLAVEDPDSMLSGRRGTLELDGQKLAGALGVATETSDASCLAWQPVGSRTASPIKSRAAGRIIYREPPKPQTVIRRATTAQPMLRLQIQQQLRIGGIQPPSKTLPTTRPKRRDGPPHDLHLRSGDVIPCEVVAIDERGVHITSPVAAAKIIPQESVKAIELASGSLPSLRAAKKERLLTLPRFQRDSPPTHLLHSRTGDLLRCRLIAMGPEFVRVEIQLAETDIPKDRIARIIWFHEDEIRTSDDDTAAGGPSDLARRNNEDSLSDDARAIDDGINRTHFDPLKRVNSSEPSPSVAVSTPPPVEAPQPQVNRQLVQVLRPDGNRTTFDAEAVNGRAIVGTSAVLGDCRFPIADIDVIVFGERIEAAPELPYTAWRLQHAVEPLVAQDFDGSGGNDGTASPLVGQPAPEIDLTLLDGDRFVLSQCKGQIVVLDFWASWCGPCIQTMPLTEQALAEFDPAAVRLMSVNLEEPADHIRGVLERHNLRAPVALDIDGVAARRYQADAIPQVVIINREGTVARVLIGGGRDAVEQMKSALRELLSEG